MTSDARGSIGGVTFSRARGGAYVRGRVTPTDPITSRRSAVRALLTDLAQRWSQVLTSSQRDGWRDYAALTPDTNRVGATFYPSGFNRFVGGNSLLLQAGGTYVDNAPLTPGIGPSAEVTQGGVDVTGGAGYEVLAMTFVDADATDLVFLSVSPPISPGITSYYGPYTGLTYSASGAVTVSAVQTTPVWNNPPGVAIGEVREHRVQVVTAEGKVGVPWFFRATIV